MRRATLLLVCVIPAILLGADPTGGISGKVVDPSGSIVAGAKLTVESQSTGLRREATSASDGGFLFPLLPPGTYKLSAEAPGSAATSSAASGQGRLNATVGGHAATRSLTESVQVEANAERWKRAPAR